MDGDEGPGGGWFDGLERGDRAAARTAVEDGSAGEPRDWPALAVEAGFAADADDYYDALHEATLFTTREAVRERERADDRQLIHAVRAMDDAERTANELAERAVEWGGTLLDDVPAGIEGARAVAGADPDGAAGERARSFAERAVSLADEADELRRFVERTAPSVAPNLAGMAGPVLAARLIALAGGLESLARKPSGTVQVLGAEDALFAHLAGHAPSPKHGAIHAHEYVRGTRPEDRGSAARALAGKLTIAARVDHYAGDYRPGIHADLRDRMATIRARADGADDDGVNSDGDGGNSGSGSDADGEDAGAGGGDR